MAKKFVGYIQAETAEELEEAVMRSLEASGLFDDDTTDEIEEIEKE